MFGNKRRDETDPSIGSSSSKDTVIAEDTRIQGNMVVPGSLHLMGALVGDARVEGTVHVGASAEVDGDVWAQSARVSGQMRGNLKAKESIDLLKGAKLVGDVYTQCLRIEDGAILQGHSFMGDTWVEDDD